MDQLLQNKKGEEPEREGLGFLNGFSKVWGGKGGKMLSFYLDS